MGDGNALAEFKSKKTTTVGFTVNEYCKENDPQLDIVCQSPIPNGKYARTMFARLRGSVRQVFDVFGPCTYSNNPLWAIIFLGMLLKKGGQANIIVSSIKHENIDQSPLGYGLTRQKITQFFNDYLSLDMTIARTAVNSKVSEGICYDFLITIRRAKNSLACTEELDTIFAKATTEIGSPKVIIKHTNWGNFKNGVHQIEGRRYNDSCCEWRSSVAEIKVSYKVGDICLSVAVQFDEKSPRKLFGYVFSEFFLKYAGSPWHYDVDQNTMNIHYKNSYLNECKNLNEAEIEKQIDKSLGQLLACLEILEFEGFNKNIELLPGKVTSNIEGKGIFQYSLFKRKDDFVEDLDSSEIVAKKIKII